MCVSIWDLPITPYRCAFTAYPHYYQGQEVSSQAAEVMEVQTRMVGQQGRGASSQEGLWAGVSGPLPSGLQLGLWWSPVWDRAPSSVCVLSLGGLRNELLGCGQPPASAGSTLPCPELCGQHRDLRGEGLCGSSSLTSQRTRLLGSALASHDPAHRLRRALLLPVVTGTADAQPTCTGH